MCRNQVYLSCFCYKLCLFWNEKNTCSQPGVIIIALTFPSHLHDQTLHNLSICILVALSNLSVLQRERDHTKLHLLRAIARPQTATKVSNYLSISRLAFIFAYICTSLYATIFLGTFEFEPDINLRITLIGQNANPVSSSVARGQGGRPPSDKIIGV